MQSLNQKVLLLMGLVFLAGLLLGVAVAAVVLRSSNPAILLPVPSLTPSPIEFFPTPSPLSTKKIYLPTPSPQRSPIFSETPETPPTPTPTAVQNVHWIWSGAECGSQAPCQKWEACSPDRQTCYVCSRSPYDSTPPTYDPSTSPNCRI